MSISLLKLYNDTKSKYKLELVAGDNGINRLISWVYYSEDNSTIDFIRGNELIFTTGLEYNHNENWLLELIKSLIIHNASGLVINIGNYIKNIPKDIINFCNKYSFPLITMPWEIHLVDIMQDYCNSIITEEQKSKNIDATIKNLLLNKSLSYEDYDVLSENKYDIDGYYYVCKIDSSYPMQDIINSICNISFNYSLIKYNILPINKDYFLVFHSETRDISLNYFENLSEKLIKKYSIKFFISSAIKGIKNLPLGYDQSNKCSQIPSHNNCMFYDNLGIYKLLLEINKKDSLIEFYNNSLGNLIEYDKKHNTDLLTTLKLYLLNNSSIQAVADATFTHRNTINYRIRKIKNILDVNIDNMPIKMELLLSFYIKNIL